VKHLDNVTIRRVGSGEGLYVWILIQYRGGAIVNPQGECSSSDGETYLCENASFADSNARAGTKLQLTAVLVDQKGHEALRKLYDTGYNAATHPATFLAKSHTITVTR
jgi:hypothetical protein